MFQIRLPGNQVVKKLFVDQFDALERIFKILMYKGERGPNRMPKKIMMNLRKLAEEDVQIDIGGYEIPGWGRRKFPYLQERYLEVFHECLRYRRYGNFNYLHEFLGRVCEMDTALEMHGYEWMDGAWFGLKGRRSRRRSN